MVKQKQRKSEGSWKDRISNLPDELLNQILSELSTKDSVCTSVLSKRWRNLWLHVPALELDSDQFSDDEDFTHFIDDFLESNEKLELKRFKLIYQVCNHYDSVFDSWIKTAAKRRIRHLTVQNNVVDSTEEVKLPRSFYSCETLVSLTLYRFVLCEHESFSLPCLKTMHLEMISYDNDGDSTLETLITSCLSLEALTIIRGQSDFLETETVRSKSLKSFKLKTESSECLYSITSVVIDAPRLEYMSLSDHFAEYCIIQSIAPSAEVDIDVIFDVKYGELLDPVDSSEKKIRIGNFLTAISTVHNMIISTATLEVMYDYCSIKPLPQFTNLYCLHASFLESSLEILPILLESCPNLHIFVLELDMWRQSVLTKRDPIKLLCVPQCFQSSLELVHLDIPMTCDATSDKMNLAIYFLRNCAVLQKLKLSESFDTIIKKVKRIPKGH